ncbi:2-dehydropantoate 2-reductase [Shewanella sp. OMA3-2]|uniref:2-dehydropantoate 2-reductase n=1 Tax=Shewanella sp. OMA3-2 TaxID=2908650 RepID=UPI001F227E1B|nr:2-dehydropantoate 2-reductase [Shewanella sp. OMA3-2]UJF21641.1 2-dehydropantoate 2-reductase [Shewanella sp. OMA3-2]
MSKPTSTAMNIAVYGAGSTGCYLAAELLLAKQNVTLICRERIKQTIVDNGGIAISDYHGANHCVMPTNIITDLTSSAPSASKPTSFDLVFVTLKCHQVDSNYLDLLNITHANSSIIFMQNGLGSFDDAAQHLPHRECYQGITPFNVLQLPNGRFHKGTEGSFMWPNTHQTTRIAAAMNSYNLSSTLVDDMAAVIDGKLLLNLNNALNVICDLPIQTQLKQRPLRLLLAQAMQEWLDICHKTQRPLRQFTKVAPKWLPFILRLPNGLFNIVAKSMLAIDPDARSSMWEDIQAKRLTEIDYLNGAVVKLGAQCNIATPVNELIYQTIKQLEQGEKVNINDLTTRLTVPKKKI